MNGVNSNTSGENQGKLRLKPAGANDRIPPWLSDELVRRGYVVLEISTESNVVIQAEEPDDKTKVWFKSDLNGIPQGSAQVYNAQTGKWGRIDQGLAPYVAPLTRFGRVTANAGASTQTISFESVKTNKIHISLTPTTVHPDGSFGDSVAAPAAGGSCPYWVVVNWSDTSVEIDFYAVPAGGFTFLWKVEAIPS